MSIPPGIYNDVSNEDYHRGPGVSKTGLCDIMRSPAFYKFRRDNPQQSTSTAMLMGSALHCAILEPDEFNNRYAPDPMPGSKSKDANAMREALRSNGIEPLHIDPMAGEWDRNDWRTVMRMVDAINSHKIARTLLSYGKSEVSVYWNDEETLCKCRPDRLDTDVHNVVIDIKTCQDASPQAFARAAVNFHYYVSAAFTMDGMEAVGKPVNNYVFVCVENKPPHGVACYVLGGDDQHDPIQLGRNQYKRALDTYRECMQTNHWPAYTEQIELLELPVWAYRG